MRPAIHTGANTAPPCINIKLKMEQTKLNNTENATANMRLNSCRQLGILQNSNLHKLHLQSLPLQLEIRALNLIEVAYLSKIIWKAVPKDGSCKSETFLTLFCCANLRHLQNILISKVISRTVSYPSQIRQYRGDISFKMRNASTVIVLILLICKKGMFVLFSNSS